MMLTTTTFRRHSAADAPPHGRRAGARLTRLWTASAPLTATGLAMIGVLALTIAGLALDPRSIAGAPAWLKPAKFAASMAIYSLTLAWMMSMLPGWPRTSRVVGIVTAGAFVIEMAAVALQAGRGTTSHFNVSTPFDASVFALMGVAILVQTLASAAFAVALWRQHFADPAMGWALRLGLSLAILAAMTGGLMTQPTDMQLAELRKDGRLTTAGAHSVGGPDGGPGLPGVGWSTTHGDLRIAHFAGLHAMQVLPLLALAIARTRRSAALQVRSVIVAAASYAGLCLMLFVQALRGNSITAPDDATLLGLAAWLSVSVGGWYWSGRPSRRTARLGNAEDHHDR